MHLSSAILLIYQEVFKQELYGA